jgi:DNA helicase-4
MELNVVSRTFHGFARQILAQSVREHGKNSPSDFNSLESLEGIAFSKDEEIAEFIEKFFNSYIENDKDNMLEQYFSLLMVPQYSHENFTTIEEYAQFVRSGIPVTLAGERVKSHGEWLIANFLFCNQVPYKYEAPHEESKGTGLWYRPDFSLYQGIYIEYFGVDKNNKTLPWIDSEKYVSEMHSKIETHKNKKTSLVELTYQDLLDGKLVKKLRNSLENFSIPLKPLKAEAILEAANNVGYTNKLNISITYSFPSGPTTI